MKTMLTDAARSRPFRCKYDGQPRITLRWRSGDRLVFDLLPGRDAEAWLLRERSSAMLLPTLLAPALPRRFEQRWCEANRSVQPLHVE